MDNDIKFSIGFSSGRGIFSGLIRWFIRGKASHTFIIIKNSFLGADMVMQATTGGFQMMAYDTFLIKNKIIKVIELGSSIHSGVLKASRWLGMNYDYSGLFGSAFVIIGRWLRQSWQNPLDSSKALFCSEVIVKILQESNYPDSHFLDPSSTNPQDLLEFFTKN